MTEDQRTNRIVADALRPLRRKMGWLGKTWVVFLLGVVGLGVYAYYLQSKHGLMVTGMRDTFPWGLYITLFVFLVAVSLVGAVISSILKLARFEFRRPVTRMAEFIAVGAILFAPLAILVHTNHVETAPQLFYDIAVHGRLQSPIIWDVLVVNTYLCVSLLLLYIPMIPDLAYCRDHLDDVAGWRKTLYRLLALNWRGTPEQKRLIERAETLLVVLVIPVAVGIHTVTSWLFAVTYRPGWDSTAFGPYFVTGAFVAGVACVIVAMYVFRKAYGLKAYLTDAHFDRMGKLLVLTALIYLYFNINEFLVPGYKLPAHEAEHLHTILSGEYSLVFWSGIVLGVLLPAALPIAKFGRKPAVLSGLAVLVVIGHWLKRFAIVVPTMSHPFLPIQLVPPAWQHYSPTWQEWAITAGLVAGALLVITLFARLFPAIPIADVAEGAFTETTDDDAAEPALRLEAARKQEEAHG